MSRSSAALALGAAALLGSWLFGSLALAPVGVGIVAAALGARLWRRRAGSGLVLERTLQATRLVEGDTLELELRLTARLPRWSRAVARERIGELGEVEVSLRQGRGRITWPDMPRGRHVLGPAHVLLEDPLGLEQARAEAPATASVLVRPRVTALGSLFTEHGRDGFGGRRTLPRRGAGADLHGVRDYQDGEPLRLVHWPTTARRGALTVMELQEAPRGETVVVLDRDAAGDAGPRGRSSFDDAVRVTASLVGASVARGRHLALVAGGADGLLHVGARDGSWEAALDLLASVRADATTTLAALLSDPRLAAGRAADVIVVTCRPGSLDSLDPGRAGGVVLVDAPTYAGSPASPSAPALLRLAGAGVPVAVIRCGDDLAKALGGVTAVVRSA